MPFLACCAMIRVATITAALDSPYAEEGHVPLVLRPTYASRNCCTCFVTASMSFAARRCCFTSGDMLAIACVPSSLATFTTLAFGRSNGANAAQEFSKP